MAASTVAIAIASIGAFVTIAGWNVTNFLARRREDRTRRLELTLSHTERQIEELYGPLLSLTEQIRRTWVVQMKLLREINENDRIAISKSFRKNHFFPLHKEIMAILSSKIYLIEDEDIPESFQDYLEHSTEQLLRDHLEKELSLDATVDLHFKWPKRFDEDIRKTLKKLMSHYNECLNDLDPRAVYRINKT